jgi:tRNA (cmo5U34)-methyltransferase
MGTVGDNLDAGNANWTFGGKVAENFDSHVSKSVPLYKEGHKVTCALSDYFLKKDSIAYELGCSTGELTLKLAEYHAAKPGLRLIGIDVESGMIDKANQKKNEANAQNVSFLCDDALQFEFEKCDLVVAYYTVQFVRPSVRQQLFAKLYESLNWGGALILFEKVRANDARFQDIITTLYNDYKLEQGYNADEIVHKTRSLKGVLEPFSSQGNVDLMKRAGFVDIITVMKYLCFEGFLAIK